MPSHIRMKSALGQKKKFKFLINGSKLTFAKIERQLASPMISLETDLKDSSIKTRKLILHTPDDDGAITAEFVYIESVSYSHTVS